MRRVISPHFAMENKVVEGQYRLGYSGLVCVLSPRAKIRDEVIHHGPEETGVIFLVSVILCRSAKDYSRFESPALSEEWQYHTAASIMDKWPKVLSDNWLEELM